MVYVSLYMSMFLRKKNYFFFKNFKFSLVMYFTMYKSENGKNILSESSESSATPPPKSYVAGHIDLPTPEHIEVQLY
jgi:hypothetical protein